MRVIIAGSRDITDYELVKREVEQFIADCGPITEVVCGCAKGVDTLGRRWAEEAGLPVREFEPDWMLGKKAGPLRNQKMADYAEGLVLVHHHSRGSLDMLKRATQRELVIRELVVP